MSIANNLKNTREKLDKALNYCNEALTERNVETVSNLYDVGNKIKLIEADNAVRNSIIEGTITEFADDKLSLVGDYAFYGCTSLSTIDLPTCSYIGSYAFQGCTSLSTISLPMCSKINIETFNDCTSLTSVDLPVCSNIGMYAFRDCTSLTSIKLGYSNLASLSVGVFMNTPIEDSTYTGSFGSIYVPASLVDAYKTANYWSAYADRITAMEVL